MVRRPPTPVVIMTLAALLLAADTLAWLGMQRLLDRRLGQLVSEARHAGWQLDIASRQRGGWPIAATLTLSAPVLHGADGLVPGGITWSGERVTAVFSPVHPRRITVLTGGAQTVSAASVAGSGPRLGQSLRFWGAETALHMPLVSRGRRAVSFDAGALHVALPGAGPDDVLTVAGLDGTLRWNDDAAGRADALALRIGLRGVGLPIPDRRGARQEGVGSPHVIGSALAELSLIGALGSGDGDFASRVRGWRDGGGRMLLREAVMDWGSARLQISGEARLDQNFRPDGTFSVRISGADTLLDSLVQSGRMTAGAAGAVRAVLGLIAAAQYGGSGDGRSGDVVPGAGGVGGAVLELPLVLRGGTLLLGQIPLLTVPFPPVERGVRGGDSQLMGAQP